MNEATQKHLVLGTAGHIDHGKSSLIKALTGVDPDRLSEEKRRGITIELGFAELELPDGSRMGVVDVPGHERFVRQMIAGASGIDVALLCIAADDGIMPQTREHKAVLEILGIKHCVVALTKCDLVDADWLEFVRGEIQGFLESSPYSLAPIVAVSSRNGAGLDALKQTIAQVGREVQEAGQSSTVRYPIDRVFSIKGSGTVVTGTLWSGSVKAGDELELLPQTRLVRVRSVQMHGKQVECAEHGNRVAINLNTIKTDEVRPGDFLTSPGTVESTDRFDAWINYLDITDSGKPLKSGARLRVAHGTREVTGRLLFMDGREGLAPKESCFAQLRLDKPLPLSWQDRFVLRQYSPARVVSGGVVLQAHPKRRTQLHKGEAELLEALRSGNTEQVISRAFEMQTVPISAADMAASFGVDAALVLKVLNDMAAKNKAVRLLTSATDTQGEEALTTHYAARPVMQKSFAAIEKALLSFHQDNPTIPTIAWTALQKQTEAQGLSKMSRAAFQSLLKAAAENGIAHIGEGGISHPRAGGAARDVTQKAAEQLFALLAAAAQAPPSVSELIASSGLENSLAHRALGVLEKQGQIRRVNKDLCFETEALAAMEKAVRELLSKQETATVAELKEAMNTSRKYAVPLLEYFDSQKITRRAGDGRALAR